MPNSRESNAEFDELLRVAMDAAAAGARALGRRPSRLIEKGGDPINLVTDRDLASQRVIFRRLRSVYPDHLMIGEENADLSLLAQNATDHSPPTWIVDPLDGTSNFSHGYAPFAVSIGHMREGKRSVGVVVHPQSRTIAWAVRGRGAFARRNGRVTRLHVTNTPTLERSLVLTGYGYRRDGYAEWLRRFGRLMVMVQAVRTSGSAVNDLLALASGACDIYWEDELQPWDWAAGALIVEEAGGHVSSSDGGELPLTSSPFVRSNGILHDAFLRVLR